VTRAGAQFKTADVAGAVHKDETRVKTPVEGSLSGEGGSAINARRGDDGSLHSGGSVAGAGVQLKSTDVAEAVHKDETRVKTPGEGSLSSEGGSAVDARRGDDGPLHRDGEAAGAEITSTSAPCGRSHTPVPDTPALQTEPTVETDVTGVDLLLSGSFDTGGLVSSIVKPQQRSRERAPRNKSASLRADLVGEDRLQDLHFTLRLPTDPTTHLVVGQEEDTVSDVIQRLSSGPWTEADILITMNDTPLSWTERVHERVLPGSLVIVSLNIRAQQKKGTSEADVTVTFRTPPTGSAPTHLGSPPITTDHHCFVGMWWVGKGGGWGVQGDTGGPLGGEPRVPDVRSHVQDPPDRIRAHTPRLTTYHH